MYRKALEKLIEWKRSSNRKPLVLRGARQVGKTWLLKEFGKTKYSNMAYINFEGNKRMEDLFSGDLEISRIISGLQLEAGCKIDPENTVIIFDEVQEVPKALTCLKYFYENAPQYHIIAAGSLLGVAPHQETSFPVGKVAFTDLFPLSFGEFLQAMGQQEYLNLLHQQDWSLITVFKHKYLELLKQYILVGGMPEAVASFTENKDYNEVRQIQNRILLAYEQDFSKHIPGKDFPRVRALWNSIPSQLAKENKKFIYKLIRRGARGREYELAMTWLNDCGLIHKISRITRPDLPLSAYQDVSSFKLYLLDVGLLCAMSQVEPITLLEGNEIFNRFKGSLTEQYVLEQLISKEGLQIFYWSAEAGTSELDFIIHTRGRIIPIEVKASENLKAKSLKVYRQKYQPGVGVRISSSDYRKDNGLINLPLYALPVLIELLSDEFSKIQN